MRCILWSVSLVLLTSPSFVWSPWASTLEEEPNAGSGWALKHCAQHYNNIQKKPRRSIGTWKKQTLSRSIYRWYIHLASHIIIRSNRLPVRITRLGRITFNNPMNLMSKHADNNFASEIMGDHISPLIYPIQEITLLTTRRKRSMLL